MSGEHRNPERRPGWFTTAYFHTPEELRDEVVSAGLTLKVLLAVEGVPGWLRGIDDWLDNEERLQICDGLSARAQARAVAAGCERPLDCGRGSTLRSRVSRPVRNNPRGIPGQRFRFPCKARLPRSGTLIGAGA